jgi:hypothetical protein
MVLLRREALMGAGLFDTTARWAEDEGGLSNENVWQRFPAQYAIAHQAISTRARLPARPTMRLRAWSVVEFERAHYALREGFPQRRQLWHAGRALLAYPFEQTKPKLGLLVHTVIGKAFYQRLQRGFKRRALLP